MGKLLWPLQFSRQNAEALEDDAVMTTAQRLAYLTSPLRYAGQPVYDSDEDKCYYMNKTRTAWLPFGSGGSGGTVTWNEVTNKPQYFPTTVENVIGLQELINSLVGSLIWKTSITSTGTDPATTDTAEELLSSTYPTPSLNWAVRDITTQIVYVWNGTEWINLGILAANDDHIHDTGDIINLDNLLIDLQTQITNLTNNPVTNGTNVKIVRQYFKRSDLVAGVLTLDDIAVAVSHVVIGPQDLAPNPTNPSVLAPNDYIVEEPTNKVTFVLELPEDTWAYVVYFVSLNISNLTVYDSQVSEIIMPYIGSTEFTLVPRPTRVISVKCYGSLTLSNLLVEDPVCVFSYNATTGICSVGETLLVGDNLWFLVSNDVIRGATDGSGTGAPTTGNDGTDGGTFSIQLASQVFNSIYRGEQ